MEYFGVHYPTGGREHVTALTVFTELRRIPSAYTKQDEEFGAWLFA